MSAAKGTPHLWLPYCQMQKEGVPRRAKRTQGTSIFLDDDTELVDGIASWWTAAHGYNHPAIYKAVQEQLLKMPHVMFGGLLHDPAERLAERLVSTTNGQMSRVFLSESGSVSVEIAMKMAVQVAQRRGMPSRKRFISFEGGYHGDTFAAMSLCDPADGMHTHFSGAYAEQYCLPLPRDEETFAKFSKFVALHSNEVAGIIVEPFVQCAGGMLFHEADALQRIEKVCREHQILFIVDEIAVGLYRLGSVWAHQIAQVEPDLLTTSKALTGGTMPLAATLATEEVFEYFCSDDDRHALMHGPTFMANALGCAAACGSLDLFAARKVVDNVDAISAQLLSELAVCRLHAGVVDVRVKGAIGVVELDNKDDLHWLRSRFIEEGVWIRPLENVVYLMPSLTITPVALQKLTSAIDVVLKERARNKY
ncbi:MAG: adenosylmethionine--8-amino-7-oxononanoate transaminase [Deltaproteobacteria bacterium]|nr:adenosylmethionine--8-amino-7-oxononanoate transaminase [Deltaproteobacteria bacterium]